MAEKDIITGQDRDTLLQGHDADGITEFDNEMPLWWLVGFIFTIVFAIGYIINYHMAEGLSSKSEYDAEVAAFNRSKEPSDGKPRAVLTAFTDATSLEAGKAIFTGPTNQCYTCHRPDLGGLVGPNLTDEYWIHGGDLESIVKSIETGYREKGMQPYGTGARLTQRQVVQVASFVLSMKGSNPPNPKAIDPAREVKFPPEAAAASPAATEGATGGKGTKAVRTATPAAKAAPAVK